MGFTLMNEEESIFLEYTIIFYFFMSIFLSYKHKSKGMLGWE